MFTEKRTPRKGLVVHGRDKISGQAVVGEEWRRELELL